VTCLFSLHLIETMETKELDQWIISFVEENTLAIALALATITLIQLILWLRKSPITPLLEQEGFHSLKLITRKEVNHNTRFMRFALQGKKQKLGLPVGQCLVFRINQGNGQPAVSRPYTPVSGGDVEGHVDFIIKIYPNGEMTPRLDKLKVGQSVLMKGPRGKFKYRRNMKSSIGMLAGGTGITPMYQVLSHILNDPEDKTHISLIYANITPSDILLRQDLDGLVARHPSQFDVYYVIEKDVPIGWKYGEGYITRQMIEDHCPPPKDDSLLLWCGPPPMIEAMKTICEKIGYKEENIFGF